MSSISFDSKSLESAIELGKYNGESFDSLMGKEAFYKSDKLYTAAVKIINSYDEHKNMPALKRACDILSNTQVTSLPIHKTGLVSSYYMWGYNSAKSQSEKIITTHFSEYLQTVAAIQQPGYHLENKLAQHDVQIEHFLKAFGIPDSEWSELKSLISQGKEADAVSQWNSVLSQIRIASPGTFNGTQDVEDFLLGRKTLHHLLQPKTPLQARFLSVFSKLDPLFLDGKNFTHRIIENHALRLGTTQQNEANHKNYQAQWAKLQIALLEGNDKLINDRLNFPIETHNYPLSFLNGLTDLTFEKNIPFREVLNQSDKPTPAMEEGKVTPIPLDNRIYFAAFAPRDKFTLEPFKKSLFDYNVNVIVDLRGELEIPAKMLPQRVGEEFNGIKLLDRKDEKIDGVPLRGQYLTRMTLEITSPEGQKKTITLLQVHHWMGGGRSNSNNIEENALRYISYEAAKLERSTKGRMLVTSEDGATKTAPFILYHHLSQNNEIRTRKASDDAYNSARTVYELSAYSPTLLDPVAKKTLFDNSSKDKIKLQDISTQNMELDDFINYVTAMTVDTVKIQNSIVLQEKTFEGQFEHFVSGLSLADKKLCLSALADTLSYVSPKLGEPEPVQTNFFYLLNNEITFQQLVDKYKQTFNENDVDIAKVVSVITDPLKFSVMYPESKNHSALYRYYERTLELQGNPHGAVDVIRYILQNNSTEVMLIRNNLISSGIRDAVRNNLEAINAFANEKELYILNTITPLFKNAELSQILLLEPIIFQNFSFQEIGITYELFSNMTEDQKKLIKKNRGRI